MGKPRGAASVVIVSNEGNFLLIPEGNFFQLPGGKIQKNESASWAIIRETAEEIGKWLDMASLESLCKTNFMQKGQLRTHHFFLYRMSREEAMLPSLANHTKTSVWIPAYEASKRKNFRCWHYRKAVRLAKARLAQEREAVWME